MQHVFSYLPCKYLTEPKLLGDKGDAEIKMNTIYDQK